MSGSVRSCWADALNITVYASVRISRRLSPSRPATRPSNHRSRVPSEPARRVRRSDAHHPTTSPATRRRYPSVISRTRPRYAAASGDTGGTLTLSPPPTTRRTRGQIRRDEPRLLRLKMKAHQRLYLFDLCHVIFLTRSRRQPRSSRSSTPPASHSPPHFPPRCLPSRLRARERSPRLRRSPSPTPSSSIPRSRPPPVHPHLAASRRGRAVARRRTRGCVSRTLPAPYRPRDVDASYAELVLPPCDCTRRGGGITTWMPRTGATTGIERVGVHARHGVSRHARRENRARRRRPSGMRSGTIRRDRRARSADVLLATPPCARDSWRSRSAFWRCFWGTRCSSWRSWRAACGTERGGISG